MRIRQCDIIYIAIENRKSAVYVDGKRIETNYSLDYWKKSLNPKIFAQPHSSFLVNLCYVEEINKDFVKIKQKPMKSLFSSVQFSRSVVSDSLRPHESQHARPPCPSPTPGVHSDSRPSSQ